MPLRFFLKPVPCAKTELQRRTGYQMQSIKTEVLGEGNCGKGDRSWEGSLRMMFALSQHQTSSPGHHSRQSCEVTNRNVVEAGGFLRPVVTRTTKPFPTRTVCRRRTCAAKVHVPYSGRSAGAYPRVSNCGWKGGTIAVTRIRASRSQQRSSYRTCQIQRRTGRTERFLTRKNHP